MANITYWRMVCEVVREVLEKAAVQISRQGENGSGIGRLKTLKPLIFCELVHRFLTAPFRFEGRGLGFLSPNPPGIRQQYLDIALVLAVLRAAHISHRLQKL
jgi:hypothetical protein